ncbi:MAG: hypothetical protein E7536_01860 [Ruminococcaceae bacterium]|nr:hypothetical protein [Oscillospiraceae bacterium]
MKKAISLLLCVILAFSVTINAFAAEKQTENKYPFIFIHGMFGWGQDEGINKIAPYWGGTTGSLMEYLRENNMECYDVSVGPISSAWDNACEIYAQLTGTTVDYGEAHSKAHGHSRYGRTYEEPVFEGWSESKKIHLIGHSHGGQVARILAHLLAYGDKEEINATPSNEISGLFAGGKENYVESVTTICSPNNGTIAYNVGTDLGLKPLLKAVANTYAAILGRTFLNGILVDFHLEHFGLTNIPGKEPTADGFFSSLNKFSSSEDTVILDLSFKGAQQLNQYTELSENINYFCYSYNATSEKTHLPTKTDFPFLILTSMLLWFYGLPEDGYGIVFDESWRANDGLVDTVSAKNPIDEPAKDYDGKIEAGIWNVMPTLEGDHGTPIGLFSSEEYVHNFYDNLTAMLISLEK